MADQISNGVVKFTNADGSPVWAAEGSKAHREHLKSKCAASKKPVEAPVKNKPKA